MRLNVSPVWKWVITLGLVVLIVTMSIWPGEGKPGDSVFMWLATGTPKVIKKLIHVFAYAALSACWFWTLEALKSQKSRYLLAFVVAVSLGVALEAYQTMVPGRYGTLFDAMLNTIGAFTGLLVVALMQHRKPAYASRI